MAPQRRSSNSSSRPAPSRIRSHSSQTGTTFNNPLLETPDSPSIFPLHGETPQPNSDEERRRDAFETSEHADTEDVADHSRSSIDLDELPIELITLTDSFIESLSAKVHSTPPSIEKLSQLFQDFYFLASSHINTHINALASRQSRDVSPTPSSSSISSAASRFRSKPASLSAKDKPRSDVEQQMITAEELAEKKRARKLLEAKKGLLEEAVERRLCEAIYDRIYRHRSTHDEAQDDKLRSKTAALSVVGIGPSDLGVDLGKDSVSEKGQLSQDEEIGKRLESARRDLIAMCNSHYPLGKLNHLKAVHKSIVDVLAHFQPSASADEIMPMLIFTLITLPPENLHVISDLHFMQNFRWEAKLTGEAAYCLTNLEATISFLQTVDLATLRADEQSSGLSKPPAHSNGIPKVETFPPAFTAGLSVASQSDTQATAEIAPGVKPVLSSSGLKAATALRNRRLSDLVNTPAQAFGVASDAVLNTADQGLKTISNSLGESYTFLLGKLRERQQSPKESILVPRTLEDARKLVGTPPPDEDGNASENSSALGTEDAEHSKVMQREERVLTLIGGRRDHSADSTRSGRSAGSSKRVVFADPDPLTSSSSSGHPVGAAAGQQSTAVLEQMRNLGNSFNPMARLPSLNMIRGFGRNPSVSTPPPMVSQPSKAESGGDSTPVFPDLTRPVLSQKAVAKIAPPNKRFMEIQSPGELRLGEVLDLLRDYRRLAGALKKLDAFEEKPN